MRPNRPNNTRTTQRLLASGYKFKQEGRDSVLQLKRVDLPINGIQAFQLISNDIPFSNILVFIGRDYIQKVESTAIFNITPEVITQDLFFVEIEFVENVEALS